MKTDITEKGVRVADSRMLDQQKGFFEKLYKTTRWSGKGGIQEQFIIDYKKCDTQDEVIALYNKYILIYGLVEVFLQSRTNIQTSRTLSKSLKTRSKRNLH